MAVMHFEVDMTEHFPAASVHFEDEDLFGVTPAGTVLVLGDDEAADLRRARDEWHTWETRLLGMLTPGCLPGHGGPGRGDAACPARRR